MEKGCSKFICSSGNLKPRLLNIPLSYHIPDTVAGGNAGLAATYCAQQLNKPIHVIVPESTPVNVVKKLEKNGAEVLVFGKVKL